MSRSKHTEAQMITALKQVEAGRTADEVAREYGVSKHTIYAWKAKYGGAAEETGGGSESGQGHVAIGDPKKLPGLVARKTEVRRLREEFRASERRICELMSVARSSCRYESRRDDGVLRDRLQELAREHPRFGYRRLHVLLRRDEVSINHKKVQRVYREMGLSVKRNRRKRLTRSLQPRPVLTAPGEQWSIDFASDVTASGRCQSAIFLLASNKFQNQLVFRHSSRSRRGSSRHRRSPWACLAGCAAHRSSARWPTQESGDCIVRARCRSVSSEACRSVRSLCPVRG